jgi:hypothetical protein
MLRRAVQDGQGEPPSGSTVTPAARVRVIREPALEVGSKEWLLAQAHRSTADKYGQVRMRTSHCSALRPRTRVALAARAVQLPWWSLHMEPTCLHC